MFSDRRRLLPLLICLLAPIALYAQTAVCGGAERFHARMLCRFCALLRLRKSSRMKSRTPSSC